MEKKTRTGNFECHRSGALSAITGCINNHRALALAVCLGVAAITPKAAHRLLKGYDPNAERISGVPSVDIAQGCDDIRTLLAEHVVQANVRENSHITQINSLWRSLGTCGEVDKLHIVASIIRSAARMLEKDVVDLPSLKKILNKQQIPWGTFLAQANAAVRTSRMHPMQDPDDRWQNEQDMRVVQDHLPSTTRTDRLTLSRR